jgi:hypothetical protein
MYFGRPWSEKVGYSMTIWNILWALGNFCEMCDTFLSFGAFSPVLVYCTENNLATLTPNIQKTGKRPILKERKKPVPIVRGKATRLGDYLGDFVTMSLNLGNFFAQKKTSVKFYKRRIGPEFGQVSIFGLFSFFFHQYWVITWPILLPCFFLIWATFFSQKKAFYSTKGGLGYSLGHFTFWAFFHFFHTNI